MASGLADKGQGDGGHESSLERVSAGRRGAHGASIFHLGAGAWRRGFIGFRDVASFAWQQARFVSVGENLRHLSKVKERALELVAGHTEADLVTLAQEVYEHDIGPRLWPETVELAREHLRKGHEVWLVTATPQIIAQVIADRLGLTGALGTLIDSVDGVFTGRLDGPVLHGERKAVAAAALAAEKGAALVDCWPYSDSSNDIPLLSLVGNRIAVNPDRRLARHAREHGWAQLRLKRSSIREVQRRVRREARAVAPPKGRA